jgi:hypothetical protein
VGGIISLLTNHLFIAQARILLETNTITLLPKTNDYGGLHIFPETVHFIKLRLP